MRRSLCACFLFFTSFVYVIIILLCFVSVSRSHTQTDQLRGNMDNIIRIANIYNNEQTFSIQHFAARIMFLFFSYLWWWWWCGCIVCWSLRSHPTAIYLIPRNLPYIYPHTPTATHIHNIDHETAMNRRNERKICIIIIIMMIMSASIRMHLFSVRIFRSFCTSFEPIFMFINKHYCAPLVRYQQCTSISRSSFDFRRFVGVSFVRWITRAHDPFFVRQYANEIIWTIFWMMMCNNNFQWIFISIFLHASNVVPLLHFIAVTCCVRSSSLTRFCIACIRVVVGTLCTREANKRKMELAKNAKKARNTWSVAHQPRSRNAISCIISVHDSRMLGCADEKGMFCFFCECI